jgi:RNA polymerase sporulation-specific sigma factor
MIPTWSTFFLFPIIKGAALLISYISNTCSFPEPLKEEEEEELLKKLDLGDETARNILIERNLRLVAHIAKKFDNFNIDIEDLISIGSIGLIKAIKTFDRTKKTRLGTYAAKCIENEILMYIRTLKKMKKEVFLYEPIDSDSEGNEIRLIDIIGINEGDVVADEVEGIIEQDKLREKVKKLSGRERKIVEMRYGLYDGIRRTQREISKALGISRSYVSRIEKRALSKLQKDMVSEGYH